MTTSPPISPRYCRSCGYNLHALPTPRCPECGRPFDPDNPATFETHPSSLLRQAFWRWTKRFALTFFFITLLLATTWTCFYWGWYHEQTIVHGLEGHIGYSTLPYCAPFRYSCKDAGIAFDRVTSLYLSECAITDAQLQSFQDLRYMQLLYLDGTLITDAGLVYLQKMPNLRNLDLHKTQITDTGLAHLKTLQNLQHLDLDYTPISDTGLAQLKDFKKLQFLSLNDTLVSDAGLVHLKKNKNLHVLQLRNTAITDAGLEHLKELNELEWLNIHDTQITDAGLIHLKSLTKLRALWLRSHVTQTGVRDLKTALPTTEISY